MSNKTCDTVISGAKNNIRCKTRLGYRAISFWSHSKKNILYLAMGLPQNELHYTTVIRWCPPKYCNKINMVINHQIWDCLIFGHICAMIQTMRIWGTVMRGILPLGLMTMARVHCNKARHQSIYLFLMMFQTSKFTKMKFPLRQETV